MQKKRVIILGAGLTGLTTAWKLASAGVPVIIIEKENDVGGLAGTIDWDGWKFDYGPHNFHTGENYILEFYKKLLPDHFKSRTLKARLFIFNKLVPFPLKGVKVFLELNKIQMIKALVDFTLTRIKAFFWGVKETEYLDEWIIQRFGKFLYSIYFGPYIERVWKMDGHKLSKVIGELKIPILSIREHIKREFFKKEDKDDFLQWDKYYVKWGIGQLSRFFYNELLKMPHVRIILGSHIDSIAVEKSVITSVQVGREEIEITPNDYIVSTIPLTTLIKILPEVPENIRATINKLDYCSERFLFLKIKKTKIMGYDWIYISDGKYPFNRVSEFNYDQFEMVPEGYTSLTVEFPCNDGDSIWSMPDNELLDITLSFFDEIYHLEKEDIIGLRSAFQDYAYPRFIVGYPEVLHNVFCYLENIGNIFSIGRQGMFCYLDTDEATIMGLETADILIRGSMASKRHGVLLKKYHNMEI